MQNSTARVQRHRFKKKFLNIASNCILNTDFQTEEVEYQEVIQCNSSNLVELEISSDNNISSFSHHFDNNYENECEETDNIRELNCSDTSVEYDEDCTCLKKVCKERNKNEKISAKTVSKVIQDEQPELNDLRVWAVSCRIPKIHLNQLLEILHRRLIPNIPLCSKTLLRTSSAQYTIKIMTDFDNLSGEYVYLGINSGLQKIINPALHPNKVLELDFNIDGAKIKKSSLKSMWPILCRVYCKNIPYAYKPFAVCIFYGNHKPNSAIQYFGILFVK